MEQSLRRLPLTGLAKSAIQFSGTKELVSARILSYGCMWEVWRS